jgi:exopolysaccharide production protein ExoZ
MPPGTEASVGQPGPGGVVHAAAGGVLRERRAPSAQASGRDARTPGFQQPAAREPAAQGGARARAPLRSLQVLRAVAAASVVYFHIGATPRFGSFGVDIFFVLSGFVMAMIVARGEPARLFAINRISRIVPLYWVVTTAILLAAIAAPALLPGTRVDLGDWVRSLLFIPYAKGDEGLYPILTVGWTLNYEMAFYATVWLALVLAPRHVLPLACALVLALHLAARTVLEYTVAGAFFGNAIVFEFVFGIAAFRIHRSGLVRGVAPGALAVIALGAYVSMAIAESAGAALDRSLLYGLPSTVLVIAALNLEHALDTLPRAVTDVLVAIGDASYATYLVHWLVLQALVKSLHQRLGVLDPHGPAGIVLLMTAALIAGQLVYAALDRPLSRRVRSWFG